MYAIALDDSFVAGLIVGLVIVALLVIILRRT